MDSETHLDKERQEEEDASSTSESGDDQITKTERKGEIDEVTLALKGDTFIQPYGS